MVLLPLAVFMVLAAIFMLQLMSGRDAAEIPSALIGQPAPETKLAPLEGTGLPGVDSTLEISRIDGNATFERTDRGLIAVLNDPHKGRHSGPVWALFIDLIAIACVVFAITGFGNT